jgi:hypothetical protein
MFFVGEVPSMRRRSLALFLVFTFVLTIAAWGREDRLTNTGVSPAATGKVTTDNDRNGNTSVDVQVKYMAMPQALTPAKNAYLVWVQPRGKDPELLGVLRVNDDREGSLKATTPYKDFDIFITAEDNPKPDTPGSMVILKGTVERH